MFTETTLLRLNSPYLASKASADLIVSESMPVNIACCSNNYGLYLVLEKLMPLMIHGFHSILGHDIGVSLRVCTKF